MIAVERTHDDLCEEIGTLRARVHFLEELLGKSLDVEDQMLADYLGKDEVGAIDADFAAMEKRPAGGAAALAYVFVGTVAVLAGYAIRSFIGGW